MYAPLSCVSAVVDQKYLAVICSARDEKLPKLNSLVTGDGLIVITQPEIKTADEFERVHATNSGHDVWATWNRELLGPNTFRSDITVVVSDVIATVAGELGPSASAECSHPSSRSLTEPANDIADCRRAHMVGDKFREKICEGVSIQGLRTLALGTYFGTR
jgi:hypothetical protein